MGSLIPIGGGADAEIKGRLNAAFNDTNIGIVRNVVASENIFDGRHHLHRVAYRLGTYPTKTYPGDNAKGKWFFFLKQILKNAAYNGVSTADSIRAILSYALSAQGVKRVVFDARQGLDPNADHYVDPGNPATNVDIARLVDTTGTLTVALICPAPLPNTAAPTPNQDADLDRDANGNIIEKKPIKIFDPANLAPPILLKETRQPKGKTKVKKAKKTKAKKGKAKKK
ncbi:hypothetical protein [Bradyrhizobium sp. LTSPM299]|uniref:hypothetical protein n=1 Tax=Bradyrhizobium sp. LTSPM299 TaxID=1619233 RepID=UPI000AC6FF57|nr:hypothetical protein [Bradyrhizobium sp. LTSPM299]